MKTTVSLIKADVGSVAGHSRPHPAMMEECRKTLSGGVERGTINDFFVTRVGDDINLLMTHSRGEDDPEVHRLAWDAFMPEPSPATQVLLWTPLYGCEIERDALKSEDIVVGSTHLGASIRQNAAGIKLLYAT